MTPTGKVHIGYNNPLTMAMLTAILLSAIAADGKLSGLEAKFLSDLTGLDAAGEPLPDGTKVHISMTAVPHYYRAADGSYSYEDLGPGATMTTPLTIDNTAPEILDVDISGVGEDRLTVTALDNEYVAAVAILNNAGTRMYTVETPNQTEHGIAISIELDLREVYGKGFLVAVYDYAKNRTVYKVEVDMGEAVREYFTAYDSTTNSYVGINLSGVCGRLCLQRHR